MGKRGIAFCSQRLIRGWNVQQQIVARSVSNFCQGADAANNSDVENSSGANMLFTLASDGMQNSTDINNLSRARLAATEVHLRSCGMGVTNALRMCDRLVYRYESSDVRTAAGINPASLEAQKAGDSDWSTGIFPAVMAPQAKNKKQKTKNDTSAGSRRVGATAHDGSGNDERYDQRA